MSKKINSFVVISSLAIVFLVFSTVLWVIFSLGKELCLEKGKAYLTSTYKPTSYDTLREENKSIFFWENKDTTIACKSSYENNSLLGWSFIILSSTENFSEKIRVEDITETFFRKIPVNFDNYTCGNLGVYGYMCETSKISEEGLYVYRILGYNEGFDTFENTLNKEIKNLKTEIHFCYLTNKNEIWKEGHYPCGL